MADLSAAAQQLCNPAALQAVGPTSLDMPAWVQAIGSVAALIIAISLWLLDRSAQRRMQYELRREKLTESIRLVQLVAKQVASRHAEVRSIPHLLNLANDDLSVTIEAGSILREHVLNYLERFVSLPLDKWPDAAIATAYFDGVDGVRVQVQNFERILNDQSIPRDDNWIQSLKYKAKEIDASFRFFERFDVEAKIHIEEARKNNIDSSYPSEANAEKKLKENRSQ